MRIINFSIVLLFMFPLRNQWLHLSFYIVHQSCSIFEIYRRFSAILQCAKTMVESFKYCSRLWLLTKTESVPNSDTMLEACNQDPSLVSDVILSWDRNKDGWMYVFNQAYSILPFSKELTCLSWFLRPTLEICRKQSSGFTGQAWQSLPWTME